MNEITDTELLERFARTGSEEAFAVLVNRHVHLVHSAALRYTANPHHAEEITQAVFIVLARKARSLGSGTVLPGWLYRTARLAAANFQRAEARRTQREQEAFMQSNLEENPAPNVWRELSPLLDTAMTRLGQHDHDALVLRYFENKSLEEVGQAMGIGERAAQKRISRALEKLRRVFGKNGVKATAAIIAGAISTHSVQAAPAGLAVTISSTAIQGTAVAASTLTLAKGTLYIMSWMKAKTAAVVGAGAVAVLTAGAAVTHYHMKQASLAEHRAQEAKFHAEAQEQMDGGGLGSVAGDGAGRSGSGSIASGGGAGTGTIEAESLEQHRKKEAELIRRRSPQ